LKALPLFSALSAEDSATLVCNSRIQNWERGEFLFMHGDAITHFYVICRGTVQIFRSTPDGHEVTSDMLIAGDSINAQEIVGQQEFHAMNARAVDDASILRIPVAWMRENLNSFDHLAAHLMAGLAERLHNAQMEAEHRAGDILPHAEEIKRTGHHRDRHACVVHRYAKDGAFCV